jgi:cyclomaltodextrinase / maltogenic alpha-amylase / neopullulanase
MLDVEEGLAIGHQYRREPSIVRPGMPVLIWVEADDSLTDVAVTTLVSGDAVAPAAIASHGRRFPARRVGGSWVAVLPGLADGSVVSYVVSAREGDGVEWYGDGKHPIGSATIFTHRVTSRIPPDWTDEVVLYQIMVDRFADGDGPVSSPETPTDWAGGDLHGVRNALGYLESLGINAVWLTPIFRCVNYHGYDAVDLLAVDERFGGDGALAGLVEAAHARGIRIVLDLVPNHVSDHHPWFVEARAGGATRDWFRFAEDGSYDCFFGNAGMPKIDLDHPDARAAMIAAAGHWLSEFGVDGYRIDHALGPSESFFAAFSGELNRSHPEAWLFGEVTASAEYVRRYGGLLDGATDFGTAYALRELLAGRIRPEGFVELEQEAAAVLPHDSFTWVRFLDNHDMDRGLRVWDGDTGRLVAGLSSVTSLPGVPCMLYGTEQALSHAVGTDEGGLDVARPPMRFDGPPEVLEAARAAIGRRRAASVSRSDRLVWDLASMSWRWGTLDGRIGSVS